jgi:hypothetical protein
MATALVTGCSSPDLGTNPTLTANFKGGTATPTPPAVTANPTIALSSSLFPGTNVVAGQTVSIVVVATSESGNRRAPTLALASAPAGLTLVSSASVDGPHGGGPGYVEASYTYTPSRDQIGLAESVTFTVTSTGGATSGSVSFGVVQDAPTALTGLTAVRAPDHIDAHWQPSAGGTGTISYVVSACYRNANIRQTASTCDVVATTTSTQAALPLLNASPTVAPAGGVATYFEVLVKPVDAAGNAGPLGTAAVQ